jgi:type I restriction enzyme S subunit
VKLSDFVEINPSIYLPKGKEAEFIPMEAIDPLRRYVRTYPKKKYSGGSKFVNGDTLFARITPCLENGKIAQFISTANEPAFGSTEYWVFRAKAGKSDPGFVYYLAKSDLLRKPAEKSMVGASGRQRAQIEAVQDLDVGNVSLDVQQQISRALGAYDNLIENNSKRIEKLEAMARLHYKKKATVVVGTTVLGSKYYHQFMI